jgi:3-hydroxyacyl-[acyl-carrier-protein] dehydratase
MTIDNARFRKPVVPGDRVEFHVLKIKQRGNIWKFHCDAKVDGALVAEADIGAMIVRKDNA